MKRFLRRHADDVLMVAGAAAIVYPTFRLNELAGWYVLGFVLVGFGVLVGMGMRKEGE